MDASANYVKFVEWSSEDNCFVGSWPGLFYGVCQGQDEQEVFAERCQLVKETVELYRREERPLPPPTTGKDYANLPQSSG